MTEISTLDKGDEFYLDVIYFKDKKVAQGFIEACYHFGMMSGYVSKKSTEKGVFVLLTRTDDRRKDACILEAKGAEERTGQEEAKVGGQGDAFILGPINAE